MPACLPRNKCAMLSEGWAGLHHSSGSLPLYRNRKEDSAVVRRRRKVKAARRRHVKLEIPLGGG